MRLPLFSLWSQYNMLLFLHTYLWIILTRLDSNDISRRRFVSLSLVYGLSLTSLHFFRPVLGLGLLSKTIRLPLFSLWSRKTCSYFFIPVLAGYMLRRRSVSLSLGYGLRQFNLLVGISSCRPVLGGYLAKQHRHLSQTIRLPLFSLWSQYNLILFLQFVLEGCLAKQHRLLSQTIRLPVFSLWSQYNLILFLQTCLRRIIG
jgi:hypothetical protein